MELALTPWGRVTLALQPAAAERSPGEASPAAVEEQLGKLAQALAANQAQGLFLLATERLDCSAGPTVLYWRNFAARYLTALCHTPETAEAATPATAPPDAQELAALVADVPPMQGAEYLNATVLVHLWEELDAWVRAQVSAGGEGVSGFLRRKAPLWHQVGRVCFHLAENRRDAEHPFAFLATYAPGMARGSRVQYQPLSRALQDMAGAKNKPALIRLLSPVHRAAQQSALVKELVESGDLYHPLAWTPRDAYRFLKDTPVFEECGLLVRMPDWWKKRPRPRVGVKIGQTRQQQFNAASMLDFSVQVALGDQPLSHVEWQQLLAAEDGLVLLRGQWVVVDRAKLQEALDHWKRVERQARDGMSFIDGMRLLAGVPVDMAADGNSPLEDRQWAFVEAGPWLSELLAKMRSPENLQPLKSNHDLKASLRQYQETGVRWLRFLSSLGLGACLADDMGLGKTLQVLALLQGLRDGNAKPSLLVLPASLLANWRAEMTRFTPALRAAFVHPAEMSKEDLDTLAADPAPALRSVDVVATSYGMLLRQEWLLDMPWRLVVLDEAQAIKNPSARQTRTVKRLKAEARIALTGTPVENRLSDLWSLFDFLCPGLLGSAAKFKQYVKQLNEREQQRYAPLRSLVQPYILRRLKTDRRVIDDLPEKVEVQAFCGLSKRQAAMYAKMVEELAQLLENVEGMKRRGAVLAYLLRFKQLCNHPSHLLGDGRFVPDESGKFARLAEICEEIAARQERALVFTQFREMTDPLASFLADVFGRPGLVLHGETAVRRRQTLVDQFQRDDGPPFFVLSLKAGGTGLNLTAASHVIHFDRWWNPAMENQATDRAFRIGQKRNVLVHKFVCRGTIEERIDTLIEEKRQLAADLLEGGAERLLTEMTDAELIRFVSLDIARSRM